MTDEGAHASGLMEMYDPSMQERFNPGPAARNGVTAAIMAQLGFTGAATILEGKRGFCRAFTDRHDVSRLTEGLGTEFPMHFEYKAYSWAVLGRPIAEFMLPGQEAALRRDWARLMEEDALHDLPYRFATKAGSVVDVLVSARVARDAEGTVLRIMGVLVDVTERRHSEERFSRAFELAPVPMSVWATTDHRILSANQAFLACVGQPAEAVLGRTADELRLWEAREARQGFMAALERDGTVRAMDARIAGAGGEVMDCLLSADIVSMQGERRALVAMQDITDRRRSEAQLFEAIEAVMRDTSWFSRTVIERLMQLRQPDRGRNGAVLADLTPREQELLGLVSAGLSDVQIAARLSLSRSTVRNHVGTIYGKIDVHSRSAAIVWARERGIAGPAADAPGPAWHDASPSRPPPRRSSGR